jgi:Flp pilus assembly protein CpaB
VAIQANKPNNRVFLLLGVVLAGLAFGGVLFALRQGGGGATTSIVVAKTSITAGSQITADELTTAAVPQTVAPPDAFTDPTSAVGKTVGSTVSPNTPIVPALFQSVTLPGPATATTSNGTAATAPVSVESQLTKGFVALAIPAAAAVPAGITLSQQNSLSGELVSAGYYILPGDHIDILVDNGVASNPGTRYAFQDIPVLRVGTSGTTATTPSMFLVEVTRNQAELLTTLIIGPSHPFLVRYVLRPQTEWGKLTATAYTPNYEPSTGPAVPQPADTTVTSSQLDSLFGH